MIEYVDHLHEHFVDARPSCERGQLPRADRGRCRHRDAPRLDRRRTPGAARTRSGGATRDRRRAPARLGPSASARTDRQPLPRGRRRARARRARGGVGRRHPLLRHRPALRARPRRSGGSAHSCAASRATSSSSRRRSGACSSPNPAYAGGDDLADGFDVPNDLVRRFDPTLAGVRRSIEDSLERIGLDRIDIAVPARPRRVRPRPGPREGLPALAQLRDEGVVEAIGVGINDADVATRAVREGDLDLVMIAGRYTLLEQPALDGPAAAVRGSAASASSTRRPSTRACSRRRAGRRRPLQLRRRAPTTCSGARGRSPTSAPSSASSCRSAALQYPLRHPAVRPSSWAPPAPRRCARTSSAPRLRPRRTVGGARATTG